MSVSKKLNKTTNEIRLLFKVSKEAAQNAERIYLLCESNGWDPIEMQKLKSGEFKADIKVSSNLEEKSEYQYRFHLVMADGQETYDNDWEADRYVSNPFGDENSLVDLKIGLDTEKAEPAAKPAPAKETKAEDKPAKATKSEDKPAKTAAKADDKPAKKSATKKAAPAKKKAAK
ncbi:MAG: isoamylase early set domain-containing protein [Succinivibrionaceae bacterium]|nr:isoamylase early set domain-containing protein [Succinivibrionaceae bacterium]